MYIYYHILQQILIVKCGLNYSKKCKKFDKKEIFLNEPFSAILWLHYGSAFHTPSYSFSLLSS